MFAYPPETTMPGAFAAGTVRLNSVKRVTSVVGEGAIAIQSIHAATRFWKPMPPAVAAPPPGVVAAVIPYPAPRSSGGRWKTSRPSHAGEQAALLHGPSSLHRRGQGIRCHSS